MKKTLGEKLSQDLRGLRLADMADTLEGALKEDELGKEGSLAFLEKLIRAQQQGRAERSRQRRIKKAQFPHSMTFETFDWNFQPALNVEQVKDLMHLDFVARSRPLLILGKIGTGKTHLATSFGIKACEEGYRCAFFTLQDLLNRLYASLADTTTDAAIAQLTHLHLLIIDAVGYIRIKPEYPSLLFDLVSACQHRTSLILTSNISVQEWGQALGNPSITGAIVDRLFDRACLISITPGRSYRTEGPHAPFLPPGSEEG
jgi:DNA replication protein DnaC